MVCWGAGQTHLVMTTGWIYVTHTANYCVHDQPIVMCVCVCAGEYIDMIHSTWWGKYRKLETQKDYIEWFVRSHDCCTMSCDLSPCRLFPTREIGTNWHAQDLTRREIKVCTHSSPNSLHWSLCVHQTITKDWRAHNRVLTSYEMMLDFYGMRLRDHEFGVCVCVCVCACVCVRVCVCVEEATSLTHQVQWSGPQAGGRDSGASTSPTPPTDTLQGYSNVLES